MDSAMKPYIYEPLGAGKFIRLIELQPSSNLGDPVQCKLIQKPLKDARVDIVTPYSALSYVWGDSWDTTSIVVDNSCLQIMCSLDAALRHIREETRPMCVWPDGICINQQDSNEKAEQVLLMGEIYSSAHNTVIYLGPGSTSSGNVLHAISKHHDQEIYSATTTDETLIQDLRELLKSPWFFRIWILQELVLSQRPMIQLGRNCCTWSALSNVVHYISTTKLEGSLFDASQDPVESSTTKGSFWLGSDVLTRMQIVKDAHDQSRIEDSRSRSRFGYVDPTSFLLLNEKRALRDLKKLVEIMASRAGFGVHDPRDMVYAHLCLATYANITVDYTKSIADLYNELARETIRSFSSLRILGYLTDVDLDQRGTMKCGVTAFKEKNLASWALDWTSPRQDLLYSISELFGFNFEVSDVTSEPPCRFFGQKPALFFEDIKIVGVLNEVGTVLENIRVLPSGDMPSDIYEAQSRLYFFSTYAERKNWLSEIPGVSKSVAEIIWNHHFETGYEFYLDSFTIAHRPFPPKRMIDHFLQRRFVTAEKSIIDGRRTAVFDWEGGGTGICLVPKCARAGDFVCLIGDWPVPLALRYMYPPEEKKLLANLRAETKQEVKFVKIVGECYVGDLRDYASLLIKKEHLRLVVL